MRRRIELARLGLGRVTDPTVEHPIRFQQLQPVTRPTGLNPGRRLGRNHFRTVVHRVRLEALAGMEVARNGELGSDSMPEFERFVRSHEGRLRIALVAAYGAADGRAAAVDAMSWAWENWPRLREMHNPVGYL